MVMRFLFVLCMVFASLVVILWYFSYVGEYEIYYITEERVSHSHWSRCGKEPANSVGEYLSPGCAYHFSVNSFPFDTYLKSVSESRLKPDRGLVSNERVRIFIEDKAHGRKLYLGKILVTDADQSCTFQIRSDRLKICRPDLKNGFVRNDGQHDFEQYAAILLKSGVKFDSGQISSDNYQEDLLVKETVNGSTLYLSVVRQLDTDKSCQHMVRSDEALICSDDLYARIENDVKNTLEKKWLAHFLTEFFYTDGYLKFL